MIVDFAELVRDLFAVTATRLPFTGHEFQSALAQVARGRNGRVIQGPGQTLFFGLGSSSGLRHELDTGVRGDQWVGMVEAKAGSCGPTKNDVVIFDGKTLDLYIERLVARRDGPHFRLLVSLHTIPRDVACFCYQRGIITVEPELIPIPVILRSLLSSQADDIFNDTEMAEADRLFRRASAPLENLWIREGDRLYATLTRFSRRESEDTRYLHERMSAALLEHLDAHSHAWREQLISRITSRSSILQERGVAA